MLRAILNKSWRQHPTKHQLYGHRPPITKTTQARRTWHAGHCWRSRDELISDVLLWNPTYSRAKAGRPARTYIQQLCEDTGCSPEDLPEAMNDREKWRERIKDICASGMTWWWWWLLCGKGVGVYYCPSWLGNCVFMHLCTYVCMNECIDECLCMNSCMYVCIWESIAQSAGTVEYTDCNFCGSVRHPTNECLGYDTKQSDWFRFGFFV